MKRTCPGDLPVGLLRFSLEIIREGLVNFRGDESSFLGLRRTGLWFNLKGDVRGQSSRRRFKGDFLGLELKDFLGLVKFKPFVFRGLWRARKFPFLTGVTDLWEILGGDIPKCLTCLSDFSGVTDLWRGEILGGERPKCFTVLSGDLNALLFFLLISLSAIGFKTSFGFSSTFLSVLAFDFLLGFASYS